METLLTAREFADALRVNEATLRRWVSRGVVQCVELPSKNPNKKRIRFHRSTLTQMLQTHPVIEE